MLRDLTIRKYRSFEEFQIDGLARVNLIVGANNSGKTSLLEAVYLLVNQGDPERLLELLYNRGEREERYSSRVPGEGVRRTIGYQIAHMFYGHQLQSGQIVEINSTRDKPMSFKMWAQAIGQQQRWLVDDVHEEEVASFELTFRYGTNGEIKIPLRDDGSIESRSLRLSSKEASSHRFLTTNYLDFDDLAELWDGVQLTAEEEKVVDALRVLEPDIERIGFASRQTSNSGVRLKLRSQSEPIPLGSMGDGMRRVLSLAISTIMAENGVLLVDEIDTGLYYRAQSNVWRLLLDTAMRRNVQIFATTHSSDCIEAFKEVLLQSSDSSVGKLFRLSQRGGKPQPVAFTAADLATASKQDIEVR